MEIPFHNFKYQPTEDDTRRAMDFANDIDSSHYVTQNQSYAGLPNVTTRDYRKLQYGQRQQFTAKLAEFAAYEYFRTRYNNVTEPDLAIYGVSGKSMDADMTTPDFDIEVKSQTLAMSQEYSLSFQFKRSYSGTSSGKPLYICGVVVDEDTWTCYIVGIYSFKDVTFEPPKKESLKTTKKVLYAASNEWNIPTRKHRRCAEKMS